MSFTFLIFAALLASISAQTSLFEGSSKSSLPYYSSVPLTNFRCENQQWAGYYSDPEADCQVFHICIRREEKLEQFSFLCPNETVFHQQLLVCVWWDGFDCSSSPSLYYLNENIFEDHGSNLDLEAHVAISQGKTLIPENKIIPSSPPKDSDSIGKALLPLVKPSPEGRSLDNELESTVSEGHLNQISRKSEIEENQRIKPSRPTYLPRKSSKIQYSDVENQNTLKSKEITNPDLQLLSSPFSENLIPSIPPVIHNIKAVQTSTQPSVSKVKIAEKPKVTSKISLSISGTNLPNKRPKGKDTESGGKLIQSNVSVAPLKQERRKSTSNAGAQGVITGNQNGNPRLVQTKTKVSLKQKSNTANAIQSPFSRVQSTISSNFNLKESSLRQNKTLLSTSKSVDDISIPIKTSQKAAQKTTVPFTRIQSTVSAPASQTSPRQNNADLSKPKKVIKNSFSRVQSTVPTGPTSQSSTRQNNTPFSTPTNAIKNPFSRVQSTKQNNAAISTLTNAIKNPFSRVQSAGPTSLYSSRQNNAPFSTPTKEIKNSLTRVHSTVSTGSTSQSLRQNNAALSTPNSFRDSNKLSKLNSQKVNPKAPKLPSTTPASLSTRRNLSTTVSPIINSNKQFQRKPLKSTTQRSQQRPPFKSRPKTIPNRNLSKGLTTYDILHDLLKNVTILRSKILLKTNSDGGRRNVRQNYIQKPSVKPLSSKFSSSGTERPSSKPKDNKSKINNYSERNNNKKQYLPNTSQGKSNYGEKLYPNPTKLSSVNNTPQNPSTATTKPQPSTSTFVPTLPPTEDTRKKTTQKKGYLNVSSKGKNIQVKNFQDFLNLELPLKSSLPSSQPSSASNFPSLSSSLSYEDTFSLLNSNIYDASSTPKNGLYK
ncbi:UNVERIFIED_CONTAM: hypothetical protein RMT77_004643 [Armadillidium vulgare]